MRQFEADNHSGTELVEAPSHDEDPATNQLRSLDGHLVRKKCIPPVNSSTGRGPCQSLLFNFKFLKVSVEITRRLHCAQFRCLCTFCRLVSNFIYKIIRKERFRVLYYFVFTRNSFGRI